MLQTGQSRVQIPARAKGVQSSPKMSRPALRPTQPPIHWIPEFKWLPCMDDHSLHSSAKDIEAGLHLCFPALQWCIWGQLYFYGCETVKKIPEPKMK